MSSYLSRTAVAALAAVVISTPAAAQSSIPLDSTTITAAIEPAPAPRAMPTMMAPVVTSDAVFRIAPQEIAPVVRRREAFDRPVVLMIVGGALIVTGLLVGDDAATILYLAGAGIGGYGLYLYLQSPNARIVR